MQIRSERAVQSAISSLAGRQTTRPYLHRYAINKRDAHNNNWQRLKVHVHQHPLSTKVTSRNHVNAMGFQ